MIYLNGHLPVFTRAVDDLASFRLFTSRFCVNGSSAQPRITRAFGVAHEIQPEFRECDWIGAIIGECSIEFHESQS